MDYVHAKRVCKDFEIKHWGEYHDLYIQSDTLLLADVFENPGKFPSAPGLAWKAAFKHLLTNIDMLLMVEKVIRGGMCHSIHRYVKGNIGYMKDYGKNKELLYLKYWDVNNLYGWVCHKSF